MFIPKVRVCTGMFKRLTKYQNVLNEIFDYDIKFIYENLERNMKKIVHQMVNYQTVMPKKKIEKQKKKKRKKIIEEIMMQIGRAKPINLKMEQVKVHGIMDMKHIYYVMRVMDYQYGRKQKQRVYQNRWYVMI